MHKGYLGWGSTGTRSMAKTTIDNPDVYKESIKVGNDGGVHLSTDLAGERVTLVAEVIDDE